MKYYSELLNEIFDTEAELQKAEEAKMYENKEKDELLQKICSVADAREVVCKEYDKLINDYISKYGSIIVTKQEDGTYIAKEEKETDFLKKFFASF